MNQRELRERLLYAPRKGVFYWIRPSSGHAELLGEEAGSIKYGRGGLAYHVIQIDGRAFKRSRLAFLFMEGRWPSEYIDHINGDSLDDRWMNLREATHMQNTWNRRKRKETGLPMGVRLSSRGKFVARIGYRKKQYSLGTFKTKAEAEDAYQQARRKFYGEYA